MRHLHVISSAHALSNVCLSVRKSVCPTALKKVHYNYISLDQISEGRLHSLPR